MGRLHLNFNPAVCTVCYACAHACRDEYLVPEGAAWLTVARRDDSSFGAPRAVLQVCHHCEIPDCLPACEEGALRRDADGIVRVDDSRCTGCGDCIAACPYRALTVAEPSAVLPPSRFLSEAQESLRRRWEIRARNRIPAKCTLCPDRRAAGRPPACTFACPTGALRPASSSD